LGTFPFFSPQKKFDEALVLCVIVRPTGGTIYCSYRQWTKATAMRGPSRKMASTSTEVRHRQCRQQKGLLALLFATMMLLLPVGTPFVLLTPRIGHHHHHDHCRNVNLLPLIRMSFSSDGTMFAPMGRLYYRDREEHEEDHAPPIEIATATSPLPAAINEHGELLATATATTVPLPNQMNTGMMTLVLISQVVPLLLASLIAFAATGGHFDSLFQHLHPILLVQGVGPTLAAAGLTASGLIFGLQKLHSCIHHPAVHWMEFSAQDLALHMFGSRQQLHNSNYTPLVIATIAGLTLVTATCEEVVFRVYLAKLIEFLFQNDNAATVLTIPSVLFGMLHSTSNKHGEGTLLCAMQFGAALVYASLYLVTGNLLAVVFAHWLYDWHALSVSWHGVNTQLEYCRDKNETNLSMQPVNEAIDNFFDAFDSDHDGSLDVSDVHRAMSYAFAADATTTYADLLSDEQQHHVSKLEFKKLLRALYRRQRQQQKVH
jgi:membrane protease YdiL (CAAX protease family)